MDAFDLTAGLSRGDASRSEGAKDLEHGAADQRWSWSQPLYINHKLPDPGRSRAIRGELSVAREESGFPCAGGDDRKWRTRGWLKVKESASA